MGYGTIAIVAALVGVPLVAALVVRSKIRSFSRSIFGTGSLVQGLQELDRESYNTPLSVSGGTKIYLPQIKRDFPDFEFNTVSKKLEHFFISYFDALEKQSIQALKKVEHTEAVATKIQFEIDDLISLEEKINIDKVKTNAVSIWNYVKSQNAANITFQISMGYRYREASPRGTETGVAQVKYEVDLSYVFEDQGKDSFALNCKNCGGPIKGTDTSCQFCGAGLMRNIERVWRVSGFDQQNKVKWKDN